MMKRTLLLITILAIFVGCSKQDGKKVDTSLMSFSGHVLTVEKADAMLSAQLAVTKNPKQARKKLVQSIDKKFQMDCLISDYAKANGIVADSDEVARQTSKVLSRKRGMSAENVAALKEMVQNELTTRKVYQDFVEKQKIEIPVSEVAERRAIFERINKNSSATNALVYAQATNCWRQIVAGKIDFKKALELYDQTEGVKDSEGEWGEFSLDAFPTEELQLREMLAKMSPGDITPPTPGDNGLVIVKLIGFGANGNNPNIAGPSRTYKLARIFFHLYETFEMQDDSSLEQDLRNIEIRERWGKFLNNLASGADISYGDNGKNLASWKLNNKKEK